MEDTNPVTAATYAQLFPEQLADKCSPDALESNSGPIAYLYALYQQALALESTSAATSRVLLEQRRPDIAQLVLSRESLEKPVSPLTLAINALTRQAQTALGAEKSLPEEIASAQCSAGLPFHYPLEQILAVLKQKKLPLFELLQSCEYTFPNFCYDNLRTDELRQVMRTATGFSPALQELLLDESKPGTKNYLAQRFGKITGDALSQLCSVEFFCRKTGLRPDEIFDMLAVSGVPDEATDGFTSVKCSSAYPSGNITPPAGHVYGAAFINNGTAPALTLQDTLSGPGITLAIKGATAEHFARIHKLIHLQRALKLPFVEVDLLLMSAMKAEGQNKDFHITKNTLRAIGVFRYLNEAFGVGAEQFAALIHEITPYATGDSVPFLDRVLDGPGAGQLADIDERMVVDDQPFTSAEPTADEKNRTATSTIAHLCKALGVDRRLVGVYLQQAKSALGVTQLTRSLPLLTVLYRLNRLPRLLHMKPDDGPSLIALLGITSETVSSVLAGKGTIGSTNDEPDILDALIALANLVRWLQRERIPALSLLKVLTPPVPNLPKALEQRFRVDSKFRNTLNDVLPEIEQSLLSEAEATETLQNAGKLKSGDWLTTIGDLLSIRGVLKPFDPATLNTRLTTLLEGKLTDPGQLPKTVDLLAQLLTHKKLAQEKITQQALGTAFSGGAAANELSPLHVLPMLQWANSSVTNVLADVVAASASDHSSPEKPDSPLSSLTFPLWSQLARYALAIQLMKLSAAGLEALLSHSEWFALESDFIRDESDPASPNLVAPELDLDLLYQLTRYRHWVETCRANGREESDALSYLASVRGATEVDEVKTAARHLSELIGWEPGETSLAVPHIVERTPQNSAPSPGSFDAFLTLLTLEERKHYQTKDGLPDIRYILIDASKLRRYRVYTKPAAESTVVKFKKFLISNPGPLKVTQAQFEASQYNREEWTKYFQKLRDEGSGPFLSEPVKLEIYTPVDTYSETYIPCAPDTLGDIDLILRLQEHCRTTGVSCQTLLDLADLDENSPPAALRNVAEPLLGACNDETRLKIEPHLQESWRDALVQWLMAYWVPSDTRLQTLVPTTEDLPSYFLTDVAVSRDAHETTTLTQAIASLQHYLHRLYSHLESGYEAIQLPEDTVNEWHQHLSQYGRWNQWQAQINHPENLIHYANRPQKTVAFQELEVEINQGRLDTTLLHTAINTYLTKFERLSNLQVVSGYLVGKNPKSGTYHLIGKTNTSPAEYYWRSVDMSLRDGQERLSPLAWTEWEKIGITASGQITQSKYTDTSTAIAQTYTCDTIRPVVIAGRRYVFWVERDSAGIPSTKDQKPTAFKKLSVLYAFQQSDGFWSTANELMCLDGTVDGKRGPDLNNNRLKDDTYVPGLIVFINEEGERANDPWLTVALYNCDYKNIKNNDDKTGTRDQDYFIEMRDLLLIDQKTIDDTYAALLALIAITPYRDVRLIQHSYDGQTSDISAEQVDWGDYYIDPYLGKLEEKILIKIKSIQKSRDLTISIRQDELISLEHLRHQDLKLELHVKEAGSFHSELREERTLPTHGGPSIDFIYPASENGHYCFTAVIKLNGLRLFYNCSCFVIQEIKQDEHWNITISRTPEQAQYLDLTGLRDVLPEFPSNCIRLNTLFGKQLVARATQGVEQVLNWDTQKLCEPTIDPANPVPDVDFHGANGLYFRELFLHLPALIAARLTEQQQFEDAESWYLQYLFDPYRTMSLDDGRPACWNARPLAEVGSLASTLRKKVEPTARAFVLSRYYQQAVFLALVENWRLQGDHYYRQLTLSTLNHAWLCYQQALKLIGPLPERVDVSPWSPCALSEVSERHLRSPINPRVIEIRKTLESRLYNLRHGLTLDGKRLPALSWNDEENDPFASANGGLCIMPHEYLGSRAPVPAYRFRQLLSAARSAAQQLLDLGRHYMKLMEDEFNTSLSVLLKAQEIRISDFTLRLQQEAINSVVTRKRSQEISRQSLEAKKARYEALIEQGKSPMEEAATGLGIAAKATQALAAPFEMAAGAVAALTPTIYGMAFGGLKPEQPMARTAAALMLASQVCDFATEQLITEAGYERRAEEWQFERQQTEWDIKVLDLQIAETNVELNAATIALESSKTERANLQEAYVAMTTGFTIIPIYNWLVARQELIYGAAYDAVLSLCLSLEAAWRFEIGDYQRAAFIKTSAWSDSYKGMLAGESLLVDLQEMENAYLLANERRLTISKSFSLKTLLGESEWKTRIQELGLSRPLRFEFKSRDFDLSYPGHYLRQTKHVSISFILKPGKDVPDPSAILTQVSNTTLVQPDKEAARFFYNDPANASTSLQRNLRAQQQIALSSLVDEDGLGSKNGLVYRLMFNDGRYLPFEGTGAISEWELEIPGAALAKQLADAVDDIRVNMVYTAKDADADFTAAIKQLMLPAG
jgi:hypothetical protein